ncbi:MAG TPA: efflux RND transporter periplasmic adaptor subunit [Nitrospiraceae bacterium]|nr:efflux RND transporter periplasmic adaptor subunit [Nitrospiraceae bacterium]
MKRLSWAGGIFVMLVLAIALLFLTDNDGKTIDKAHRESPPSSKPSISPSPSPGSSPSVEVVHVIEQQLDRTARLPGELHPYLSVDLYPKVTAILQWIGVDRGSQVKRGQVLVRLMAPELAAQRVEAEAKLRSDEITHRRLASAAATPGVVAPNDLEIAKRAMEADQARVNSLTNMEAYLTIAAPFDGVITERNAHPGALVGPTGGPGGNLPMIRLEHNTRLRLIVPVPEANVGDIVPGQSVKFTVPTYPGETFAGTIARIARTVEVKTRTMPIELDVDNPSGRLAPGMFPEVEWPVRRSRPTLFVPMKAVVTTTEHTFVIRIREEKTEWVTVQKGQSVANLTEVFGDLQAGEQIVARATDELRPGTQVKVKVRPPT